MEQQIAAIVIGVSAGAVEALSTLLPSLPGDYPLPVMIVVHLPPDKESILVPLLQQKCAIHIREAMDKEPICPGTVYFAPPDYHLLVESERYFSLSNEEPVCFSRPSINTLFETAADCWEKQLLGIVLTGANEDGAHGARVIEKKGGKVLVQEPASAYAAAMPQAAIAACLDATILPLEEIAEYLRKLPI